MSVDAERMENRARWLLHRYTAAIEANDLVVAVKMAEGLFMFRYGKSRDRLPAVWSGFETELHRLAKSGASKAPKAYLIVLNW